MRAYLILAAVLCLVALVLYADDKWKSRMGHWRIRESVLLAVGFFGGALGALLGMILFHHKTSRWYFWLVNVLGLLWQAALLMVLIA